MSDHDDISEVVEIDFEVGHSSIIRSEATSHNPPRTHDWKIYLRSADVNGDLSCLIQRCVFHLHPEFPNHKRELKSTPFAIQETGYAGFHLPIEIYFKTKKEPKRFRIDYDLDLHNNIDGHAYRQKESYVQKYRCTFHNPDPDFRQKILAAGGKINDSGPIPSNNSDIDESDIDEEPVIRRSPQQKRSISPVSTTNIVHNKKVKLEQSTNNIKKKQVQSVNKAIMNIKKTKLVSHKSSSVLEEKISKTLPIKESNQTVTIIENTENSSLSKVRTTSTKLIKSQSTNDIKPSIQSTTANTKKKESIPSPSKVKSVSNSQNVLKKPINKNPQKTLIKTEQTSISLVKSPSNVIIKQDSSPQPTPTTIPSINTSTTVSISNLKKIPKKPMVPKVEEKRSRLSMPFSSFSRTSTQDSLKQQSLSSKTQSNLKRGHSSSSVNSSSSNNPTKKPKTIKDHPINQSSNPSRTDQSNHQKRQSPTPSKSPVDTSQPSTTNSPTNVDSHIQAATDIDEQNNNDHIQLSDKSNSPHEQIPTQPIKIQSNRLSYSDQSDTNDSDISIDNDNEEQDLPTSLTDDDLRYKLIYIYKRFQLNSLNDLIIFVRFFKRHQLIDISSLSLTQTTNEMFTYDLFSLSPSHIGELANDLGYTTINMMNSIES